MANNTRNEFDFLAEGLRFSIMVNVRLGVW